MAEEQEQEARLVGSISHYFGRISVGIIDLTDTLRVGDTIHVKGATTDFTQTIESMQLEHQQVDEGQQARAWESRWTSTCGRATRCSLCESPVVRLASAGGRRSLPARLDRPLRTDYLSPVVKWPLTTDH